LRLAERARDPAGGQSTEEVLMLDSQTKEELRDQLPKFQGKLREQFPDIEDRDLQRVVAALALGHDRSLGRGTR
jgi:hypothetical protein